MIQEIAPHIYHNAFHERKSLPTDLVTVFFKGRTYLTEEGLFPTAEQVKALGVAEEDLVYLFEIDDVAFYLLWQVGEPVKEALVETPTTVFRAMEPSHLALAGATALHLSGWYRANRFCGCCVEDFAIASYFYYYISYSVPFFGSHYSILPFYYDRFPQKPQERFCKNYLKSKKNTPPKRSIQSQHQLCHEFHDCAQCDDNNKEHDGQYFGCSGQHSIGGFTHVSAEGIVAAASQRAHFCFVLLHQYNCNDHNSQNADNDTAKNFDNAHL